MKQCRTCEIIKPLADYPKDKKSKGGYRTQCKTCVAAYMRDYLERNPDKAEHNRARQKVRDKTKNRFKRHNTTEEDHDLLLAKHNGLCWSCKDRPATVIDHDHSCCPGAYSCGNCIRGVLCSQCNTALGLLADSPVHIERLLQYSLQALR